MPVALDTSARRSDAVHDDLRALAGLRRVNLAGVVASKALYERKFTLAEGQRALDGA